MVDFVDWGGEPEPKTSIGSAPDCWRLFRLRFPAPLDKTEGIKEGRKTLIKSRIPAP